MHTPLYVNDGDSSPKNAQNPSLCAKNKLNLLPEQSAHISLAFINQLTLVSLGGVNLRILNTIYHQTIGYNKCEDDINGRCFQLLTGIRSDHANDAVRQLEALNIVISRPGHYGKWLSVNFDFEQWGKDSPKTKTNNPACLLPADNQPLEINETPEFKVYQRANASTNSTLQIPPAATPAPLENPATEEPTPTTVKPATLTKPASPFELDYPESFSKKLRDSIAHHLKGIKIKEHAQRLVDYFATCLQKNNIRSPIAYFISLKNRLLKGQLDLPENEQIIEQPAKNNKTADQTLIDLNLEYQHASSDHQHMKQSIQRVMKDKQCTFDKALRKMCYNDLWKTACKRLEKIKKTLKAHHKKEKLSTIEA